MPVTSRSSRTIKPMARDETNTLFHRNGAGDKKYRKRNERERERTRQKLSRETCARGLIFVGSVPRLFVASACSFALTGFVCSARPRECETNSKRGFEIAAAALRADAFAS